MNKTEIRNQMKIVNCMIVTYKVFNGISKKHKEMREGLMVEMISETCILFESSVEWLRKYRPTNSHKFEIDCLLDDLLNARYYGKVGIENLEKIEKGLKYIENDIFK